MLGLVLLRAATSLPPTPVLLSRTDCRGHALAACAPHRTGPTCDLPCTEDTRCDYALHCHSHGDTYGLSTFGAHLFELRVDDSEAQVLASLRRFVTTHPASLGLLPGLPLLALDLRPVQDFRARAGALTLLRFDQYYRNIPVHGPDARITLVADSRGVIAVRGAVLDSRIDFAHIDDPADAESARTSALAHAELWTGYTSAELEVHDLRLVAVPRARAIGWAARISHGLDHVATVVVEADADAAVLPLLHVSRGLAEGLAEPTAIAALAEDPASDVLDAPLTAAASDALFDGSPLLGSQRGDAQHQLATEQIVVFDAAEQPGLTHEEMLPVRQPETHFTAMPGTSKFLAQDAFVALANAYRWTDRFMAGRWESAATVPPGQAPLTPPGQFRPRLHVLVGLSDLPCDGAACYEAFIPVGAPENIPEPFAQPLQEASTRNETMGRISMPEDKLAGAGTWKVNLLHEFGHFVDNFAGPGMIDDGFGCLGAAGCSPSCVADTTDEAAALKETWAQIASILYLRSLYAVGATHDNCQVLPKVSRGESRAPHLASCRADTEPFSLFLRGDDPLCPSKDEYGCIPLASDWPACRAKCDQPDAAGYAQDEAGAFLPTGLCQLRLGYGTDSAFQALWELLHAQECSLLPPYTCETLPALAAKDPVVVLGEALHYAVRLNAASYRGFFDDVATHVACNAGPAVHAEVDAVLCHHRLRPCDAPLPAQCESCGNGVREGDEECDGADLGGATCETLGYDGGTLACTDDCTLVDMQCGAPEPTETGAAPTSGGSPEPDSATASEDDETATDGCDCRARPPAAADGTLSLVLAAWWTARRRRRAAAALCLLASTSAPGCVEHGFDDTGMEATSLDDDATTGAAAIDPRIFDVFHGAAVGVGYANAEPDVITFWDDLEVLPDRRLVYRPRVCAREPEAQELAWIAEDGALRLVPGADGRVGLGACSYGSARLALGPACGELWLSYTDARDCGAAGDGMRRYLPGRVCPEVQEAPGEHVAGAACFFAVTWCDERPLPACQAP